MGFFNVSLVSCVCVWLLLFLIFILWVLLNFLFVNQFLASESGKADSIFNDVQSTLSNNQGELALFARELRQVCPLIFTDYDVSSFFIFIFYI